MSSNPARFVPVIANPLPQCVMVCGNFYSVPPIGSPPRGEGYIPADLQVGAALADAHISMASRLLELTAGLHPCDYGSLFKDEPDFRSSEAALLVAEIKCQNGAAVINALWSFITRPDAQTNPVIVGAVSEHNAHAAAFAVALQVATDVSENRRPTITTADLDRLSDMIGEEALRAYRHEPAFFPSDGPEPPCYLRWQNNRYELKPRLWQTLNVLWPHDHIEVETLIQNVWGDEEGETIKDTTVRSTLARLNDHLDELGVPWQYRLRRGCVVRD